MVQSVAMAMLALALASGPTREHEWRDARMRHIPKHVSARARTDADRPPVINHRMLPPIPSESDRTAIRQRVGVAPSHLKYLGAWNANDYPQYPLRFLNLGLQDAWQFLGVAGIDGTAVIDEQQLEQARRSSAAGQKVLIRAEHVFFGVSMPYSSLCGDVREPWQAPCPAVPGRPDLANWKSRWAALHAALVPHIAAGTVAGVQLGDELLGQCLPLSNMSAVADLIRASWPAAIIYVNEAVGPMVWDRNYCNKTATQGWYGPPAGGGEDVPWVIPASIDIVGMDMQGCTYSTDICPRYNVSASTLADPTACPQTNIWWGDCNNEKEENRTDCGVPQQCVAILKGWYQSHIYKRLSSSTKAIFSPSAWGTSTWSDPLTETCVGVEETLEWGGAVPCPGQPPNHCLNPPNWSVAYEVTHGCAMPACSGKYGWDKFWADFAMLLWDWAKVDTSLAGFTPFHWASYQIFCGCGGCYNPPEDLGMTSLPQTLGTWLEIGLSMLQTQALLEAG